MYISKATAFLMEIVVDKIQQGAVPIDSDGTCERLYLFNYSCYTNTSSQ